jgi:hypothetical protein
MWKHNLRDLEQEQVQHEWDLGEIQDLPQDKISNEHSFRHAHTMPIVKPTLKIDVFKMEQALQMG